MGPWLMGMLIETGSRSSVFAGYALGAILMLAAAAVMLGIEEGEVSLLLLPPPSCSALKRRGR